jgi:hypothetical protein
MRTLGIEREQGGVVEGHVWPFAVWRWKEEGGFARRRGDAEKK